MTAIAGNSIDDRKYAMQALSQPNRVSGRSSKLALSLLLIGALLCTGAKWAEKPIATLADVVGAWSGEGTTAKGHSYSIEDVFKEDGSYEYSWRSSGGGDTGSGERPPGTVRVNGGKLEWIGNEGKKYTTTLYEHKKGKRMLKGRRSDGQTFKVMQR